MGVQLSDFKRGEHHNCKYNPPVWPLCGPELCFKTLGEEEIDRSARGGFKRFP